MSKRWGSDDKIELMRQYASGRSYEEIGKILDRSPNAIKLRLESIVYENLVKGKPINLLTRMLNTDVDTIKQFYYSHKSFKQGRGEEVKDIDFAKDDDMIRDSRNGRSADELVDRMLGGGTRSKTIHDDNSFKHRVVEKHTSQRDKDESTGKTEERVSSTEKNLKRVETENHILEEIIKNYKMKRQVKKLYVDGKLDDKSVLMYERLLKRSRK